MKKQEVDRAMLIMAIKCRLDIENSKYKHCLSCPYRHDIDHLSWTCQCDGILEDTLELLKAQEPRLITVKDFENNPNVDHDGFLPAWIEYRRDGDWDEYWEDQPDEWGVCKEDRIVYESMRYWTSRPTDEQREATAWE